MSFSFSLILSLGVMIFSTGVTWGIMTNRQKTSEEKDKISESRIDHVIKDLQEAVRKLDGMATEFQVWKAASTRYERDIEDHDKRIKDLEIAMAKRQSTRKR
jgi:hypothetical protein